MNGMGLDIESILKLVSSNMNISDLHLSSGEKVAYRLNGDIIREESLGVLSSENLEIILKQLFQNNPQRFDKFLGDKETDFAYVSKDGTAYRVNAFLKTGKIGVVMRKINNTPRVLEELMFSNIADSLKKNILNAKKGLFLVTGPTGSGKSTSLVAMMEYINQIRSENIITIEDPIEYVFHPQKCLISQREIGHDTWSFKNAIKSSLREDPDIIFVGEIRDTETAEATLNLAETGHLVFSTLHTNSATQTINRLISFFPADMQNSISDRLSDSLIGVLSQHLVTKKDKSGRIALFELLLNTNSVRNNIKKKELDQINGIIETSNQVGMINMRQYAKKLLDRQLIDSRDVERLLTSKV